VLAAASLSCGPKQASTKKVEPEAPPPPPPTRPLPTASLAGERVALYPLTLVAAEDSLKWDTLITNRRATLTHADSIIVGLTMARAPEVDWIPPDTLRKAARRGVGIATDPDKMGSAVLRDDRIDLVPSPLSTQLRALTALADSRFALVPAALVYKHKKPTPEAPLLIATAELSISMVDVRKNQVVWRTVARGDGADPWTALTAAVKGLTPGLP
jgi:hypothetical protein